MEGGPCFWFLCWFFADKCGPQQHVVLQFGSDGMLPFRLRFRKSFTKLAVALGMTNNLMVRRSFALAWSSHCWCIDSDKPFAIASSLSMLAYLFLMGLDSGIVTPEDCPAPWDATCWATACAILSNPSSKDGWAKTSSSVLHCFAAVKCCCSNGSEKHKFSQDSKNTKATGASFDENDAKVASTLSCPGNAFHDCLNCQGDTMI